MKRLLYLLCIFFLILGQAFAEKEKVWRIRSDDGILITEICYEPTVGDVYISGDNQQYEIVSVKENEAIVSQRGFMSMPDVSWLNADTAVPVSSRRKTLALYCTHSDESFEPSDGYYSTRQRGSIYEVAHELSNELLQRGIEAKVADTLHHPHDAGAYRRSRQTAVELLKADLPDALIDIHRDGIPDPKSYEVSIGGENVSKIRLLVGRGNQNAGVNKEFALMIKAVADRVYPGLIKDIYMGKGTFNQDLLPQSILFECGTYTLPKERVLASMPMMADVLDRALYGGVMGSAGRIVTDVQQSESERGGIVQGAPDPAIESSKGTGSGTGYLAIVLIILLVGGAVLSTGSIKGGMQKAGRNLHEMTGGLLGKPPERDEEHDHS